MGVFARLFGRSKAPVEGPEEAPAAEAETGVEPAAAEAEAVARPTEAEDSAADAREDGTAGKEAVESGAAGSDSGASADAAEIPKQQSAEEAADNEAGEGART